MSREIQLTFNGALLALAHGFLILVDVVDVDGINKFCACVSVLLDP
jgi:hypothetical protein